MQLFDVARTDSGGEPADFALLIRPDGGLHFVMDGPLSIDAAAGRDDCRAAYRVTRSGNGIRVTGREGLQRCVFEERAPKRAALDLLRDQRLYRISSPLLISTGSGAAVASNSPVASAMRREYRGDLASASPQNTYAIWS